MITDESIIIHLLSEHSNGVAIGTLEARLHPSPARRTLQRLLQSLVKEGTVIKKGKGKRTVYVLKSNAGKAPAPSPSVISTGDHGESYESFIPLAEESREILSYIRQPVSARKPVAYSGELLHIYVPGKSWYLNTVTRKNLEQIGKTGFETRPAGTYGRAIIDRLLIDLSWASSRLEGNTYSRLDTARLIQEGELAEGRDAIEAQMILNHKRAIELLVDDAEEVGFNRFTFLNLHGILSEGLMHDVSASGRLRTRAVEIGQSVYQPINVPQAIDEAFDTILDKADRIPDPFEQALFILVHIPYLQPFEDVNKRVSRLGANLSLIKKNLCPLTFLDVPERAYVDAILGVYELNRIELFRDVFVWAYERSTQQYLKVKDSLKEPDPLRIKYREQIHEIIGTIVREKKLSLRESITGYAASHVESADLEMFIDMAMDDLQRMHEGVIARYRIRPSEFRDWREALHKGERR